MSGSTSGSQAGTSSAAQEAQWRKWRSVADLYHAYFTGLILTVVTRRGTADAAEFMFRVFRRQQQERFLPGLEKLGLSHLPPAVAAAQYHYLSNWIGGVHVEYMYESDRKAWIRYPPPRWIWRGTAICGVPGEVSRAMLRGWHANNGVTLGNPKLGFVCTKQSVDGQDGLEGYYYEYDHALELDQRLVFARHLEAPLFDAGQGAGAAGRELAEAAAGTRLPQLRDGICPHRGARDGAIVRPRGCRLSLAPHRQTDRHAVFRRDRRRALHGFAAGRGDAKISRRSCARCSKRRTMWPRSARSGGTFEIRQQSWKLMTDVSDYHPACTKVLEGLFEGLAAGCGRRIAVHLRPTPCGVPPLIWSIG